jgi:membrane protein
MARDKSLSFTLVMGTVFLLLVSMVISTAITAVSQVVGDRLPGSEFLWQAIQTLASIGIIALAFAAIFKLLPDTRVEWRDVWWGALLTSLLFALLKQLLAWYIGNSGSFAAYGLVGAVLALLTWIYFTSQILFFGGEFTQVYARRYGSRAGEAAANELNTAQAATAVALASAVAKPAPTPAVFKRQEQLRNQRYAFAAGGLLAGVVGTLLAAVVGALVGVVRGTRSLARMRKRV